jgi:tRNA (cytidine/uridine-2'-O-)-methyltransferase
MLHVALWEPEIPPNTGNIARLCAATGAALHLIGRLGFRIDDRSLRRAGLDYWDDVDLHLHPTMAAFEEAMAGRLHRLSCFSARATTPYTRHRFEDGDILLFGSETRGLPEEVLSRHQGRTFVIPIPTGKVRSLNLASAAGIAVYEALRQLHDW